MRFTRIAAALAAPAFSLAQTFKPYTDANGIEFWQGTWDTSVKGAKGNAQFGLALPLASESSLNEEYIGHLVVPKTNGGTWFGLSHVSGMTGGLLLVTWLDDDGDVQTSFRYASGYVAPDLYTGNATLSKISETNNNTHYELTYRCESCKSYQLRYA